MDFERRRRQVQEINLTALIDIVFHLLVFVMVTTTFVVTESMELSLPSGKADKSHVAPSSITRIQVNSDDSVTIDRQVMNVDHLTDLLAKRIAEDPEAKVSILTTPGVSVQQLIAIMDVVYLVGGRNVQVDKAAEG